MIVKIHHTDLTELQQYLLASCLYFELVGESEESEIVGEQFDKLYNYDNSHDNITNALKLEDES